MLILRYWVHIGLRKEPIMPKRKLYAVMMAALIAGLLVVLMIGSVEAGDPDTNWVNPTANVKDTGGDGNGFEVNAQNAYSDWNGWAANWDGPGDRHRYYNFNLDTAMVNETAVTGIKVRLDWWLQTTNNTNRIKVELSWNGGTSWTAPKYATTESTGEIMDIVGGVNDLWGRSWTLSQFNNANFRVRLTADCTGTTCNSQDWNLDWVAVKLYYTDTSPYPPAQLYAPGPGGNQYAHSSYIVTDRGTQEHRYWVYEPRDPLPANAPIITLNHGWSAIRPDHYTKWIEHMVKRGNIVVYPQYQNDALTTPDTEYTPNAIQATLEAIAWLQANPSHTQPDLTKYALTGHSYGAVVTANMAARWATAGLPQPKAAFPIEPAWYALDASLAGMPSTILINCLIGNDDWVVSRVGCDNIWDRIGHVPNSNKDYVWMYSDNHGTHNLVADHYAPVADVVLQEFRADALEFYGTWKIMDALTSCAFYGQYCLYALDNTLEHRYMGQWSDGVWATQLSITDGKP